MAVAGCALLVTAGLAQAGEPGVSGKPTWQTLVACLNAHGVQPSATNDPVQLKLWLGQHYDSDPAVKAALDVCAPPDANDDEGGSSGPSPSDLVACLRGQGVQAPDATDPAALKTWLGAHEQDPAVEAALRTCAPPVKKDAANATDSPSLTELKTCLVQAGIDVPAGVNLKEWLGRTFDQAAVKQALRGCGVTVSAKRTSSKGAHRKTTKVVVRLLVAHRR